MKDEDQFSPAERHDLPGFTEGARIVQIAAEQPQIDAIGDVVFSQIKSTLSVRQLHMSLLVPRTNELKPAIIFFPGGGFTSAEHNKFIEMRMALARAGFVVAAAEYRVVPDLFPAPLVDAKSSVRYLRQHAREYGIDPERIAVLGNSAGGWLAQMMGVTNHETAYDKGDFLDQPSHVQAVATLFGLSDLRSIGEGFSADIQKVHQSAAVTEALLVNGVAFNQFPGASLADTPDKALTASPVGHIRGDEPPFLIMHGSSDTLVSPWQSAHLYKALISQGVEARYLLIEGAGHGDISWFQPETISMVVAWFRDTLGKPGGSTGEHSPDISACL